MAPKSPAYHKLRPQKVSPKMLQSNDLSIATVAIFTIQNEFRKTQHEFRKIFQRRLSENTFSDEDLNVETIKRYFSGGALFGEFPLHFLPKIKQKKQIDTQISAGPPVGRVFSQ